MDADNYINSPDVEMSWALKAIGHAETYFNLISSVDPKHLKLTPKDDTIYRKFREEFPDFDVEVIKEEDLKSESAKNKWRDFCETFKGEIEDYSYGTLLRLDSKGDISDANTIFAVRIQFLAIEIARNREGFNDGHRLKKQNKESGS